MAESLPKEFKRSKHALDGDVSRLRQKLSLWSQEAAERKRMTLQGKLFPKAKQPATSGACPCKKEMMSRRLVNHMRLGAEPAAAAEGQRYAYLTRPIDTDQKSGANPGPSASCDVMHTSEKNIFIAM